MTPVIVFLVVVLAIVYWCIRTVNDFKKKEIRVQEWQGSPTSQRVPS